MPATDIANFRDPAVSVFQSAVAATDARRRATETPGAPPPTDHSAPMLQATARAAESLIRAVPAAGAAAIRSGDGLSIVNRCARAYLALALAEARGDADAIAAARAALPPFGTCDSRWREAIDEFLLHYTLNKHSDVPYRRWSALDDFVLSGPRSPGDPPILPDNAKVAFVSDWGTGEARPQALLRAMAALQPDVVIHLGDIYYSCDMREAAAFFANVRAVFPEPVPVFTLCGNHDMYGGGQPYYALLDRLGQPASFFCLRNAHWQIVAMDTGYNDYDPFTVNTAATWVQDGTDDEGRPAADDYSELAWHADKLADSGGRRTVLLSHHPLFTRRSPIAGGRVRNDRLFAQLGPYLDRVDLWLWGHEHSQIIYAPYAGLTRGRCLGAGAIPTGLDESPYDVSSAFAAEEMPVPDLVDDPAARLPVDPQTGLYDLGFGLLTLAGPSATMTYYAFRETSGATPIYEEILVAPS